MRTLLRVLTAVAAVGALSPAAVASAQPDLPPVPPYIPGDVSEPGSFDYTLDIIPVGPPATVDARGINASATVDPTQSASGLPGDALGNGPPDPRGPLPGGLR